MNAAILSVGTEILMGEITDTNQVLLSKELLDIGVDVTHKYTVGDNKKRLHDVIIKAYDSCDLVISTGGLGPTEDDVTKEVFAEIFKRKLVIDEKSYEGLRAYSDNFGDSLTENSKKQALVPEGAKVFRNEAGVAPGFAVRDENKICVCLPGPPRELESTLKNGARSYLASLGDGTIYSKTIGIFGRSEPAVEDDLFDIIDKQTDPTIATYAKEGVLTIRVASKNTDLKTAKEKVDAVVKNIVSREKEYVFTTCGETYPVTVGKELIEKGITISCCESCTGGLFAGALTSVPGISEVFDRGLVTYTYEAKEDELGVSRDTLAKHTAVSREVADEMVNGLKNKTGSDLCLSVTGLAGPGGGTAERPVGLVYIGCIYLDRKEIIRLDIADLGREWIRGYAVLSMFDIAHKMITDKYVRRQD